MPACRTRRGILQTAGLLAAGTWLAPAHAQKAEDTLRVAWRVAVPALDPYRSALHATLVLSAHLFDTLVYRDPDTLQIKPLLATAWRSPDQHTLEFDLRQDVRFHDGSRFSAADVAYTVQVATTGNGAAALDFPVLSGAEVLDPLHMRLHLLQPAPLALEYLATVLPIMPQAARQQAGDDFSASPVGTGPYRLAAKDDTQIHLDRNQAYFAGGPKGQPAIGHLVFRTVPDTTTAITDLIQNRADWISGFDPSQFAVLSRAPNLQAVQLDSMRIGYLSIDTLGRSDRSRPFIDKRVRQALAHAIDRGALARQFGNGAGHVLDTPCSPTQFGCDSGAATRYDYDPIMARRLLADAGFPDGFGTELVSYVLTQWSGAVQNYLRAVGIDVAVRQVQPEEAARLVRKGEAPLLLGSWGSASINDVAAVLPHFFGGGPMDQVRDPTLERLMQQAATAPDPDKRRAFYANAITQITADADWLPMFVVPATYAFSKDLNFKPTPDELPRFYQASWK